MHSLIAFPGAAQSWSRLGRNRLAITAAKVGARFVSAALGGFALLLFVFGELFVAVGIRIARSKHGIGTPSLLLFLAYRAKFVAHLADRPFDSFHFHEQIADSL